MQAKLDALNGEISKTSAAVAELQGRRDQRSAAEKALRQEVEDLEATQSSEKNVLALVEEVGSPRCPQMSRVSCGFAFPMKSAFGWFHAIDSQYFLVGGSFSGEFTHRIVHDNRSERFRCFSFDFHKSSQITFQELKTAEAETDLQKSNIETWQQRLEACHRNVYFFSPCLSSVTDSLILVNTDF